ncbi:MAG: DUF294 nucleotidyltransferase-like domain-containing protein [Pseudomonadota bacterium]
MQPGPSEIESFLAQRHPYDALAPEELTRAAAAIRRIDAAPGDGIYEAGTVLPGLYLVAEGTVEVRDAAGNAVSLLGPGNSFAERGLMRDGVAVTSATAVEAATLYLLDRAEFDRLRSVAPIFEQFFARGRPAVPAAARGGNLAVVSIAEIMTRDPLRVGPDATIQEAARLMRDRGVSCLLVSEGERLAGILTTGDLAGRALAEGLPGETPVARVMTADPVTLTPDALGIDALVTMTEGHMGHLPVADGEGRLVGILTQTDLTRYQAVSSAHMIGEIARAGDAEAIAAVTARIPELLAQLVGSGARHEVITRLVTDIADAATRRLVVQAEAALGPAPVPYLWLACGSQGRREQTGVSDQDNCLILDDAATEEHDAYFAALAKHVSDGLDKAGYMYCPGDMMATNPRWRQPLSVWREYFSGWIRKPDPTAQMLASVMFDLRAIAGETSLFKGLQAETLEMASANSIFVAHMIANSLKHTPPLSLFRGFALIRRGEHKDMLDLKHNGVVPVVDLGRVYALTGRLEPVNTRARLLAAADEGVISASGALDLRDAYDLIAETRLAHQAEQVRHGAKPDNFMAPATLSELERSHLRDAFVVVKTMQSALGQGREALA